MTRVTCKFTDGIVQKSLKRVGVPFVLVRDTSLFERVEVLDVMAYIR